MSARNTYAIDREHGCSVVVWYAHDRWYASAPGFGASNYGSQNSAALRDMTIRDAVYRWRANGAPKSSGFCIPEGWREVGTGDLIEVAS